MLSIFIWKNIYITNKKYIKVGIEFNIRWFNNISNKFSRKSILFPCRFKLCNSDISRSAWSSRCNFIDNIKDIFRVKNIIKIVTVS